MAMLAAGASVLPQVVSGLGSLKAGKSRKPAPAIPMPDIAELQRSKRKAPASRGRASTILTGTDDGLGG